MTHLTEQQEAAMATFKENLHLPNGGFHKLIIELSKEFQLPFQKVRTVLKNAQKDIERQIREDFSNVDEGVISQANWVNIIRLKLVELAEDNQSVMDKLKLNPKYQKVLEATNASISSEDEREELIEELIQAYEKEVFKPLLAMLHTTKLYWKLMLVDETCKMTEENRDKFSDYPQHMQAAEHLYTLDQKLRSMPLTQ
ncbi:conserved hypothetical protein [Vibrio chagasii]|uniref:hypothetical protein n=1 Tax=Vibrio chagasii TaxID=170679 RepID=UPI001EFC3955|nr:hypothetical protein [Vibrio chagasii]MDE9381497.1 hypothetical protein [Vibrio alginolyticus]MCG9606256.1 hypothetical protein [Vibrio chagasii]CAH6896124.1 conserved hypothetical protein [Vibrio chagasii]CAH6903059.1 conserved hypothetical protein [Vibrio chagasii]CAH7212063.1 conserved hypothetical protein [Vibrio chagasii]